MKQPLAFLFVFFAVPFFVSAQMVITEIMYDPKDADAGSGGEWIEILNSGSAAIDLTQWVFFENETNHSLTADGAALVTTGGYVVISRDLTAFRNYFVSFSGALFKASFSLNDGETLAMKSDKDAPSSDEVPYTSESGAKNDGNSLQLVGGEWIAAVPTPGEENATASVSPPEEDEPEAPPSAVQPSVGSSASEPAPSLFTVRISEKEKFVVVGAPARFKGETVGTTGGLSNKVRFLWNFGDGGITEGQNVFHTYKYPGEYIAVLNAISGEHSTSDRAVIKAIPAELSISRIGNANDFFIELLNNSAYELNLSGWLLKSGVGYFVIPEHTFILPKRKLMFPKETTGLAFSSENTVSLLYPNGMVAHTFAEEITPAFAPNSPPQKEYKKSASTPLPRAEAVNAPIRTKESVDVVPPEILIEKPDAETLVAASGNTAHSSYPRVAWLLGVFALVLVGGIGIVTMRRGKIPADEFQITEEGQE